MRKIFRSASRFRFRILSLCVVPRWRQPPTHTAHTDTHAALHAALHTHTHTDCSDTLYTPVYTCAHTAHATRRETSRARSYTAPNLPREHTEPVHRRPFASMPSSLSLDQATHITHGRRHRRPPACQRQELSRLHTASAAFQHAYQDASAAFQHAYQDASAAFQHAYQDASAAFQHVRQDRRAPRQPRLGRCLERMP